MASSTRISYASESAAVENTKWASLLLPKIHWVQRDDSTSPSAWLVTTLVVVLSLLVLEQYVYRSKKQHLPGPTWTIPVIGKFFDSITPSMEKYKKSWSTPLSVASVFQIFIVIAADNAYSRKIFNSPTYTEPCLVASMKQILCPNNWVFLNGKAHVDYRRGLNVLFTRRAMALYLKSQELIKRQHFKQWLSFPGTAAVPMMPKFRSLNMETSLYVFCGDYISPKDGQEIGEKYQLITKALDLVNFPLALPGTKVYTAIQARKVAVKHLANACHQSKQAMLSNKEPTCLIDRWNQSLLEDSKDGTFKFTDEEEALTVLSFIFASQDAMTSSLTSIFQLVADYPEVMKKIRAEQDVVRGTDLEADITIEQLDQMPYTRAVVKETLRLRPPVIMVPYLATKDFKVSEDYVAKKGTILCPSTWNSTHDPEVYPDPDAFLPERWLPGGGADTSDPKYYMVFGAGPHKCIGNEYVYIHMAAVISSAAATMDWVHQVTPDSERIKIIPTIFPIDDCLLRFTPRNRALEA